jgi:hypothetical protein
VGHCPFKIATGCICWQHSRFTLDYFARSFAPEMDQFSIAVLDSSGNLIMRIGRYGNVDDGMPLRGQRADEDGGPMLVPPNPRPLGGDEIALMHACHVATMTDRYLYIGDVGNGRIVQVKLDYHATETVALKNAPGRKGYSIQGVTAIAPADLKFGQEPGGKDLRRYSQRPAYTTLPARAYDVRVSPIGGGYKTPRFGVDEYRRVYYPNGIEARVGVIGNEGNRILWFGTYGNRDSTGGLGGELVPTKDVPMAWPNRVDADDDYICVTDIINTRLLRLRKTFAVTENVEVR